MINNNKKYILKIPSHLQPLVFNPLITEIRPSVGSDVTLSTDVIKKNVGKIISGCDIHYKIPESWLEEYEDLNDRRTTLIDYLFEYINTQLIIYPYVTVVLADRMNTRRVFAFTQKVAEPGSLDTTLNYPIYIVTNKGVKGIGNNLKKFLQAHIGKHDELVALSVDNAHITRRYLHLEYNSNFIDTEAGFSARLCKWSPTRLDGNNFMCLLTSEWLEDTAVESLQGGLDGFNEFKQNYKVE